MTDAPPPRRLGPLLLIGLLTVPAVFGWVMLRRSYPRSLRRTVLIYAVVVTVIPAIGRLGG